MALAMPIVRDEILGGFSRCDVQQSREGHEFTRADELPFHDVIPNRFSGEESGFGGRGGARV